MGNFDEGKYECKECGRAGNEDGFAFCGGCEEFYCYKVREGCNWINKEDEDLYICEACLPRDCEAGFTVESSQKRVLLESPGKFIWAGQAVNESIEVLKSEGYVPRYRLDREENKIVKYGVPGSF